MPVYVDGLDSVLWYGDGELDTRVGWRLGCGRERAWCLWRGRVWASTSTHRLPEFFDISNFVFTGLGYGIGTVRCFSNCLDLSSVEQISEATFLPISCLHFFPCREYQETDGRTIRLMIDASESQVSMMDKRCLPTHDSSS